MPWTEAQQAIIDRAEAQMKRNKVNPETNQPGDVPEFKPVGVEGYDPQTGEINKYDSAGGKALSFAMGANDLPVIGPVTKAAVAGGATLATKGIDALTGLPSKDTVGERYNAMRDMQESALATNPGMGMAGRVAGSALVGGALPMPASMGGAAISGGALGAADDVARNAAQGKMPSAGELALQTGTGAAGGIVGRYLGKSVSDFLGQRGIGNSVPSKVAQAVIKERSALENSAGDAMDAASVVISKDSVRSFVDKTLQKMVDQESLNRNTTPDAWKAARVLLNEAGKDENMTMRGFNNLRTRIRDILPYSAAPAEEYIVNRISHEMNDFMLRLPVGNPKVVIQGDAQAGVKAWQEMNKFTQEKMRGEILGRIAYKSQLASSQRGKGISFGQALQSNILDFLSRSSKKSYDELSLFSPSQIHAFEEFVAGSKSVAFDNILNTYIGTGLAAGTTRAAIRGTAVGVKAATRGGDTGTKEAFIEAIKNSGASTSVPDTANINLSPAAASLTTSMSKAYHDNEAKIEAILNAARQQSQGQQMPQGMPETQGIQPEKPKGFPKSTVVPQQ